MRTNPIIHSGKKSKTFLPQDHKKGRSTGNPGQKKRRRRRKGKEEEETAKAEGGETAEEVSEKVSEEEAGRSRRSENRSAGTDR